MPHHFSWRFAGGRPVPLPLLNWGFAMPPPPASRPAAAPAPSAKPAPRWLRPVVLALAALALFCMFSAAVGDADTWFHLRTGAYVVQNHELPDPDPFSWTTYKGQPACPGEEATRDLNIKHEWGAQVILYLVYAAGGFAGMVLFKGCCLTFFSGMVGWVVWRRTGRFYLAVAAVMAAGMIARTAAADRPYLVTYVLMALTLWILERRRRVFHGLGAAGRILRRGAAAASARAAAEGRKDAVGGQPAGHSGERAQSELLQRDPGNVRLPAQHTAAEFKRMACAGALAAELVQWPAGGRGGRTVMGTAPRADKRRAAVHGVRGAFADGTAQRDLHRTDCAHRDRELPAGV